MAVALLAALAAVSLHTEQRTLCRPVSRRVVAASLIAPALALASRPRGADASYALQKAAVRSQSWVATGKEREMAVYESIEQALDAKRRFRPEIGELGYVGGEFTKKSMQERRQAEESDGFERVQKAAPSGYAQAEDFLGAGVMRAASRGLATP